MSWRFSRTDKASEVLAAVRQFVASTSAAIGPPPEEQITGAVGQLVVIALSAYPAEQMVRVEASGGQNEKAEKLEDGADRLYELANISLVIEAV